MKVSLKQFLQTGFLGELRPGLTIRQVLDLLGEPDMTGGSSQKYRHPSFYLYGTVEVCFSRTCPYEVLSLHWDGGDKGAFRLTAACEVVDWAFSPGMSLEDVVAFLRSNQLPFEYCEKTFKQLGISKFILRSGIHITFDEKRKLQSVYAGLS